MSVNRVSKARVAAASLLVGEGPSDGGGGTIGDTATPVAVKGITAFTATIGAGQLNSGSLTFATGTSTFAEVNIGGLTVNPGGAAAPTTTLNDVVAVAADAVIAIPPQNMIRTGLVYNAFVTTNGKVELVISNPTTGSLVLVAGKWTFLIVKLIAG